MLKSFKNNTPDFGSKIVLVKNDDTKYLGERVEVPDYCSTTMYQLENKESYLEEEFKGWLPISTEVEE